MSECPIRDDDGTEQCTCDAEGVFRLLADPRRRRIVALLERAPDNWIDVETLIRRLSEQGEERDPGELQQLLHHAHLPMLEDQGLVEYDGQSETVRYYDCELVSNVLAAIEPYTTA